MCPDIELLSAFYDDELDPMWDKQVAEHVASCSACSEKLAVFARMSDELHEIETPDFEESMDRAWVAIDSARRRVRLTVWHRRVSVPLPAFAAIAAVFVAAVGVGVFMTLTRSASNAVAQPIASVAQNDIVPVNIQVSNLNDLLSYLDSKDFGTNVTIQLPQGLSQLSMGKPELIRAADFRRGQ
jgi:anti-sigma factor RsiW